VLLDFARAYIDNGGNAIKTSTHLFVHRNTINNRLNQFYDETKMDLRDTENVKALEIILNYQLYS
jgi:DNA-binding PucR family transcriptional regulator